MIQGIDIFQPRDNGLPDFTRITPGQIFNGSVAATMNQTLDPYGLNKEEEEEDLQGLSPNATFTIDPATGKRVEVRKATVVSEMLNGDSAKLRGHSKMNGSSRSRSSGGGGGYAVVDEYLPDPELPSNPTEGGPPTLLDVTPLQPAWHPPMSPEYAPPVTEPFGPSSILLPPPEPGSQKEAKQAALRKLPTMVLEELKNLHLI